MRVLVTGSRMWADSAVIWGELDALAAQAAAAGETELIVVHGDHRPSLKNGRYEMRSADYLAEMWATRGGHPLPVRSEPHPAKWALCAPECTPRHRRYRDDGTAYCPSAGPRRNAEMVAAGADRVLAFIRNASRGASHCADLAERAGLTVERFEVRRAKGA